MAGKVEGTGRTVRFGFATKWMSALADNSCLGRLFRRVCEPAETREKAEEPAVFSTSRLLTRKISAKARSAQEKILWEFAGQTLENRFFRPVLRGAAGADWQLAIANPRD